MEDLVSGLEMIGAFLLTPILLTLLIFYCERHFGREEEHTARAGRNVEV